MTTVSIDFETRSTLQLRLTGVYPYAQHDTTDLWCMAWAVDDDEPELWLPGQIFPPDLLALIVIERPELRAWNAQFERVIWQHLCEPRYGFPDDLDPEQWVCTAAEASAMALPRALDHAAQVLQVQEQKDQEGHRLMLRMARPRSTKGGKIVWWTDPKRVERLGEYCMQDVRTERAVAKKVRRLTDNERQIYLLDQRINDRGVLIDVPLVNAANRIVKEGLDRANAAIVQASNGDIEGVTKIADMGRWLAVEHDIITDSLRKSVVQELLSGDLPSDARIVLEARAEAGRSSLKKLKSMKDARCDDDYVRGTLLFHGANTGRWAGKVLQPHNFPRGEVKNVEHFVDDILANDYDYIDLFYPPMMVVSSLLRGMLRATPGHRLMAGDFAQIEARITAWFAGQDDLVELFATGGKVYETSAALSYGVHVDEITKDDIRRQLGKATVLGCGFGMGWGAFQRQAKEQYGLDISEQLAKTAVNGYRETYTRVPFMWKRLGSAVMEAVSRPGKVYEVAHGLKYVVLGDFLWCILPSRRPLAYPTPSIMKRKAPWGEMIDSVMCWNVNQKTRQWERRALYGGLLMENIAQALARDVMAEAMLRVDDAGYPVILSIHDEVVSDVPDAHGSLDEFSALMAQPPAWATGCPVEVEGWSGARYRK